MLPCRLTIAPHPGLPRLPRARFAKGASRGSFASRSESLLTLSSLCVLRAFSLLRALCAPYLCALCVNSESSLRASYIQPLTSVFPIAATPSCPEQKRGVQNMIRVSPLESAFTNRSARNFFRIRIYENCRGVPHSFQFGTEHPPALSVFSVSSVLGASVSSVLIPILRFEPPQLSRLGTLSKGTSHE
jgi:hypothetical protein